MKIVLNNYFLVHEFSTNNFSFLDFSIALCTIYLILFTLHFVLLKFKH